MKAKRMIAIGMAAAMAFPAVPAMAGNAQPLTAALKAQATAKTRHYYGTACTKKTAASISGYKQPYVAGMKVSGRKMTVTGHMDTKMGPYGYRNQKSLKKKTYHFTLGKNVKCYATGGDGPAQKVNLKYVKRSVNKHSGLGIEIRKKGGYVTAMYVSS